MHKTDKAGPGKARVVPAGDNIQNVFEKVFYHSIEQVSMSITPNKYFVNVTCMHKS